MKNLKTLNLLLLSCFFYLSSAAQYCVPNVDVVNSFGAGILEVTMTGSNAINRSSLATEGFVVANEAGGAEQGETVTLNVGANIGTFCSFMNIYAYIDFNGDEDFEDIGEHVFKVDSVSTGTYSDTINVPLTATIGLTRMRILCKMIQTCGHSAIDPCGTDPYIYHGEVEDYNFTITEKQTSSVSGGSSSRVTIYPNPGNDLYTLNTSALEDAHIQVFNSIGVLVHDNNVAATTNSYTMDLSHLAKGIYFVKANSENDILIFTVYHNND